VRYVPAGHASQTLASVAAVVVLNLPAAQIRQSASASWLVAIVAASIRYVPAGHETQVLDTVAAVAML
jgi:hypothetical protein